MRCLPRRGSPLPASRQRDELLRSRVPPSPSCHRGGHDRSLPRSLVTWPLSRSRSSITRHLVAALPPRLGFRALFPHARPDFHRGGHAATLIVCPIKGFRPAFPARLVAAGLEEERRSSTSAKFIRSASTTHESSSPADQLPVIPGAFAPLLTAFVLANPGQSRWMTWGEPRLLEMKQHRADAAFSPPRVDRAGLDRVRGWNTRSKSASTSDVQTTGARATAIRTPCYPVPDRAKHLMSRTS